MTSGRVLKQRKAGKVYRVVTKAIAILIYFLRIKTKESTPTTKHPENIPSSFHTRQNPKMAPSNEELNRIAQEAERDLNSHQAKTGGNNSSIDDSGVDSGVTTKFPGSTVDTDVTTNVGDNRRIPPEEGGVLDDRGRYFILDHYA